MTKKSKEKYNEWEGVAPKIKEYILWLNEEVNRLEKEKEFCLDGIRDIYLADLANDVALKEILFARFGLPFVLKNEKKDNR